MPESRRLTVPLGKWSRVLKPEIEKAAGERWHLDLVDVNGEQELVPTLEKHLRSSDVLFAVADPTVFNRNTVQGILLTTYHFGVPVLGFSRNYVRAGALLAVFSTPEQMGRHIGDYIAALARNKQWELSAPEYPRYFSVAVNRQVARSLGLTIDSDDALLHRLEASE